MATELLLIDLGNSRLKWSRATNGQRDGTRSAAYRPESLSGLLGSHWGRQSAPGQVLICSVAAKPVEQTLRQWIERHWRITPHFFLSSFPMPGMNNGYLEPATLGNDRWLAAIAAYHRTGQAVAVIDCGTAITIDLVDSQGVHQGGWILPGMALMRECLRQKTAIPEFSDTIGTLAPGASTSNCIANGVLLACAGAIEKAARELAGNPQWQNVKWLLTGGDAGLLQPRLGIRCERADDLLLDGLMLISALIGAGKC